MKTYSQIVPEPTAIAMTGLRITPAAFTVGDSISVGFSLQNISGVRLTGYAIQFGYLQKDKFVALFDVGTSPNSMANRAVKSFEHTVDVTGDAVDALVADMRKAGERARSGFMLAVRVTDNHWNDLVDYIPVGPYCIIDRRYVPVVPSFGVDRCDAAGNLAADGEMMAITAQIGADVQPAGGLFSCKLRFAKGHIPTMDDGCVDLTDCIGVLSEGVEQDATMIDGVFDRAYDWFFVVEYGDEYEVAFGSFTVGQSFTNMHESGYETGGFRFGGYSRSTPGRPMFESDYPGYFYGGLANLQAGMIQPVGMTGSGNCTDIPVTFDQPFAEGSVPIVVVGFQASTTAGTFGRCSVAVLPDSVTNKGFTMRFYNGDAAGRNPAFSYIAMGTPTPAI